MRYLLPVLAVGILAFSMPSKASASADLPVPFPGCVDVSHMSPSELRNLGPLWIGHTCIEGHRMSPAFKNCLISAAITSGGVAVSGIIGGVAANAIASGMVGAGSASCLRELV